MKNLILLLLCLYPYFVWAEGRTIIPLNGEWEFEQTQTAFPPKMYTRKISVPGLVHLATPRITQYDKFFQRPEKTELQEQFNFLDIDYTPMYNWYKRKIRFDKDIEGDQLYLTIRKSQYVTVVYVNNILIGRSIECYTPIEMDITNAVRWGKKMKY